MTPDSIFIIVNNRTTSLSAFLDMKRTDIKNLDASGCTALTAIDAPAAEYLDARGCTALTAIDAPAAEIKRGNDYVCAGVDSRGYIFEGILIRDQWRVIAGCRNYSIDDAREHWGPGGESDRSDCLSFVDKIAAFVATYDNNKQAAKATP